MNVNLICPALATTVPALSRKRPLVLVPFLGQTVLEHTLAGMAASGVKLVRILAEDRVDEIRSVVGRGEAWGLQLEFPSPREGAGLLNHAAATAESVITLNHLPQAPNLSLWESYRHWYGAQLALLPLLGRQRVGLREVAPDVFVDLRSQVAADATLIGPCWIGAGVFVGGKAIIGPGSIIEDGSYIDSGAEIFQSIIGPQTYVGSVTEIRGSLAWGNELLHFETGSLAPVADRFLLSEMRVRNGFAAGLAGMLRGIGQRDGATATGTNAPGLSRVGARLKALPGN